MNEQMPSQAGRIVLTVLLAILLLVSAVATVAAAELRCLTRKETLKTVITQVVAGTGSTGPSGTGSVADQVVDNLCNVAAEEINSRLDTQVASQEVRELLAKSTLPDFIAEKVSASLSGEPAPVTQQEVQTLLDDNREIIEGALGQPLSEEMTQEILKWAAENADDVVDKVQDGLTNGRPSVRRHGILPAAAAPSVFSVISSFSAVAMKVLVICAIACLVWTVLLIVVNRRFPATGLCVSGSMYLVAGAACTLALLGLGLPVKPLLPPVLAALGLALVLLICGVALSALKKKKQKAAA